MSHESFFETVSTGVLPDGRGPARWIERTVKGFRHLMGRAVAIGVELYAKRWWPKRWSGESPKSLGSRYRTENICLAFNGKYAPGCLYVPENSLSKLPAVVLCHGNYPEGKDLAFIRNLAALMAADGFLVLSFDNLCYNRGWKPEDRVIKSPEGVDFRWAAYAAVTFLREDSRADPENIIVMGHSMGGTIALAVGATDDRIAAVASLAPTRVSRFIFDPAKLQQFRRTNICHRLDTDMDENTVRISRAVLLEENYVRFLSAKETLFVYGKFEGFWGYAGWIKRLGRVIGRKARVVAIPNAGHYFGRAPEAHNDEIFNELAGTLRGWLRGVVNRPRPESVRTDPDGRILGSTGVHSPPT